MNHSKNEPLFSDRETCALLLSLGLREEYCPVPDPKPEERYFRAFKVPGKPLRIWVDTLPVVNLISVEVGSELNPTWHYEAPHGLPRTALNYAINTGLRTAAERAAFLRKAKVRPPKA